MYQQITETRWRQCARWAHRAVLSLMCCALVGAPAVVLQGIAWVDMAQQMGGMSQLSNAIFQAEPCNICNAAAHLASNERTSTNSPEAPKSADNFKLIARITDDLALEDAEETFRSNDARRTPAAEFVVTEHIDSVIAPPPRWA